MSQSARNVVSDAIEALSAVLHHNNVELDTDEADALYAAIGNLDAVEGRL